MMQLRRLGLTATVGLAAALILPAQQSSGLGSRPDPKSRVDATIAVERPVSGTPRFAVEMTGSPGAHETVPIINDLGDGLSAIQGLREVTWHSIQPDAPINGRPTYMPLASREWNNLMTALESAGRSLFVCFEPRSRWALERSETMIVQDPRTGARGPGIVRIKPEHLKDWHALVKHYLAEVPLITHLQIDNEPENTWVDGNGYAEALRVAYDAVQEFNAENPGRNVKVLAAGFHLGRMIVDVPEQVLHHVMRDYPNIDVAWVRERFPSIPASMPEERIIHVAQKIHVVLSTLLQDRPSFDILTLHYEAGKTYDTAQSLVDWYRSVMRRHGYDRPIWLDDMNSGYFLDHQERTPQEERLYRGVSAGRPNALRIFAQMQSTWLVRKSVGFFAAGIERVSIASDRDAPKFFIPSWRYMGLLTEHNRPKPAFHTAKILVHKLDFFETATRIGDYVYQFTFASKPDVFVAWSETGDRHIDLSGRMPSDRVRLTHIVTEVNRRGDAVVKPDRIVPSRAIPVTDEPVFIDPVQE